MEVFLARQPIFNRSKQIYGYELLFRNGLNNAFPQVDGDTATCQILSNSFFCMGMDRIAGRKKAFINFTEDLLVQKAPLLFPKENLVVEILENVLPTADIIQACRELSEADYQLALDDFPDDPSLAPIIPFARIIKIDIRTTSLKQARSIQDRLASYPIQFLAEKVETYSEFEQYLDLGFDYFQGYFFSKPQVLKSKDIKPNRISLLQIMAEVNRDDIRLSNLESLIRRDLSISLKLLRYINSPYYTRGQEVSSIRQAILRLGDSGIRRFIPIVLMCVFAEDKPNELIRTSVIRARFCELLCKLSNTRFRGPELFTLGLFSLIGAIMDEEMETVIEELPLSNDICGALMSGDGDMAQYLHLVRAYEIGDWDGVSRFADRIGMDENRIPALYWEAVVWADTLATTTEYKEGR